MANEEHLKILKQGPARWNHWQEKNPNTQPDLSEADLRLADLRLADLRQADLLGSDLRLADLSLADLREANLSRVDFKGANLRGANLKGANLKGADLTGYTDLRGTEISESTQFDDKWLLVWRILNEPATRRDLSGANLKGANLTKVNLSEAKLSGADLGSAILSGADLSLANLSGANLSQANLIEANLRSANLSRANLSGADVRWADLRQAKLSEAKLFWANLSRANLSRANLRDADLSQAKLFKAFLNDADLTRASLIKTDFEGADLTGCQVYGISAWDLNLAETIQKDLVITFSEASSITVDDIEIAQFIYLMLNNVKIRKIINLSGRKGVLILGRFTEERKPLLDAMRRELRRRDYLPLMFEFDRQNDRNLTETVTTLASMSRFVIADITDAKRISQELQAIVPHLPSLPVHPIILDSQYEHAMFQDFLNYHWVLRPYRYNDREQLIANLAENVINPAERRAEEIAQRRQQVRALMAMPQ